MLLDFILWNSNWRDILIEEGIKIEEDNGLALLRYDLKGCNFMKPYHMECRGSIIDVNTYKYVCRPFDKFWNHGEFHADTVDFENSVVYEKLDGSIIKIWFNHKTNKWVTSTNGVMYSKNATFFMNLENINNFEELIERCVGSIDKFCEEKFTEEDKNYTHIFEICTPINKVVVDHRTYKLYYLTSRHTQNGNYMFKDNFENVPKVYSFKTLEDCVNTSLELPYNDEGYIVYDTVRQTRVKIKSPQYVAIHHICTEDKYHIKTHFKIIKNGEYSEVINYYPELKEYLDNTKAIYDIIVEYLKNAIAEYDKQTFKDGDFKSKAIWIKNNYPKFHVPMMLHMRGHKSLEKWIKDDLDYKMFIHLIRTFDLIDMVKSQ